MDNLGRMTALASDRSFVHTQGLPWEIGRRRGLFASGAGESLVGELRGPRESTDDGTSQVRLIPSKSYP